MLFTYQLAKKLEGTHVTVNRLHPGVVRTGFGKDLGGFFSIAVRVVSPFMMSPEKSARAAIYVATTPELENVTGKYFAKGKEEESSKESCDPVMAKRSWQASAELTKLDAKPILKRRMDDR